MMPLSPPYYQGGTLLSVTCLSGLVSTSDSVRVKRFGVWSAE